MFKNILDQLTVQGYFLYFYNVYFILKHNICIFIIFMHKAIVFLHL